MWRNYDPPVLFFYVADFAAINSLEDMLHRIPWKLCSIQFLGRYAPPNSLNKQNYGNSLTHILFQCMILLLLLARVFLCYIIWWLARIPWPSPEPCKSHSVFGIHNGKAPTVSGTHGEPKQLLLQISVMPPADNERKEVCIHFQRSVDVRPPHFSIHKRRWTIRILRLVAMYMWMGCFNTPADNDPICILLQFVHCMRARRDHTVCIYRFWI